MNENSNRLVQGNGYRDRDWHPGWHHRTADPEAPEWQTFPNQSFDLPAHRGFALRTRLTS